MDKKGWLVILVVILIAFGVWSYNPKNAGLDPGCNEFSEINDCYDFDGDGVDDCEEICDEADSLGDECDVLFDNCRALSDTCEELGDECKATSGHCDTILEAWDYTRNLCNNNGGFYVTPGDDWCERYVEVYSSIYKNCMDDLRECNDNFEGCILGVMECDMSLSQCSELYNQATDECLNCMDETNNCLDCKSLIQKAK